MSGWPLKETERREPMIEVLGEGYSLHEKETELIRRACQTALTMEGARGDITVLIADPERIQTLNRDFRHVDRVTDVLTFPAWEGEAIFAPSDGYLGDIMICMERAKEQAEEFGHSLERELAFLAVHGTLHILGYDHMEPEEEALMRQRQREILERMGETR